MKILIKVTKDVLERSKMCSVDGLGIANKNCAIAVAIRDLFPHANVAQYSCTLDELDINTKIVLPRDVSDFIESFDSSSPSKRVLMTPFSFEIEVPEYVISKIGIGQVYKVLSESRTLELVM